MSNKHFKSYTNLIPLDWLPSCCKIRLTTLERSIWIVDVMFWPLPVLCNHFIKHVRLCRVTKDMLTGSISLTSGFLPHALLSSCSSSNPNSPIETFESSELGKGENIEKLWWIYWMILTTVLTETLFPFFNVYLV